LFTKRENEEIEERIVRFRTVGDMSCTAAVDSYAATIKEVLVRLDYQLFLKRSENRRQTFRGSDGETTRIFRMKSFKIILAVFLLVLV
jgi:hypothetical protein